MRRIVSLLVVPALVGASAGCGRHAGESTAAAQRVAPDWRRQNTYAYDLKLIGDAKLPSGNAAFALELAAELDLQVLDATGPETRLRAVLQHPSMTLGGSKDAQATQISAELEKPALFVFERGRLKDAWYSPEVSGVSMSTWRTLGSALQISEPASSAPKWEAEEYDSAGRYRAEYTAGPSLIRKKTAYLAVLDANPGRPVPDTFLPQITASETRFGLDHGLLTSVELRESVTSRVDEHAPLTIGTTVSLRLLPARPAVAPFDARAFVVTALHGAPDRPAPRPREAGPAAFDQARMEGQSLGELLTFFDAHPQNASAAAPRSANDVDADAGAPSGELVKERTNKFGSLVAFLRSDPTALAPALAKIRSGAPSGPTITSALASAETPATQAALLEIVRDPKLSNEVRGFALIGFGHVARPEPTVAPALLALLSDPLVGPTALMTLGSLSRRLRDAGRMAEVEQIRPALTAALAQAKDARARAEALRAVSNSGDAALLPVVKPYLTEGATATERAAAAEALRHMKLAEVDGLLAERLTSDPAAEVSLAILRAMGTRGASPELVAGLTKAISSGSTPNVRQRAVELALSWAKTYPSLKGALANAAEKDPDPRVRAAASHAG